MNDKNANLDLINQLEIGGSIFELIEFSLFRNLPGGRQMKGIYGVNVAKVREVVRMPKINPLASRVPGIEGVFELRGVPIPAINLCHILGDENPTLSQNQQIIVVEFSHKRAGFIVSQTHRIRRVAWDKVLPPSSDAGSCMTGMILIEDNEFLFILDMEKILADLEMKSTTMNGNNVFAPQSYQESMQLYQQGNPQFVAQQAAVQPTVNKDAPGILLVDDSKLIRNNVKTALERAGYRVHTAENGLVALNFLEQVSNGQGDFGKVDCVVTDVEMPQMDGLTLVSNIRKNQAYQEIPVLLHTSLAGRATQDAGRTVGANGYVVKNDMQCLLDLLKEVVSGSHFALGA